MAGFVNRYARILFLVSSMEAGGSERVAALLCNYWAQRGLAVTLMPTFSGRGSCTYPLDRGVTLDYLADRVPSANVASCDVVRRFLALRRTIRQKRPDVILSFLANVNIAVILASRGLDIPIIVAERTYPPAAPVSLLVRVMRKLTYPWASRVVMQTDEGSRWLRACCPRARGEVIANPVVYPLPCFEPALMPDRVLPVSSKVVLAVGRLGMEKGFDRLLTAFALLAERFPDWDLVIIGEGTERSRLEAQRDDLSLRGRAHLPGRVGNLADWYCRAAICVLSSRFEGFPNALVEAMAYGLPAVSFDCDTGPRDIIRPNIDGLLVAPEAGPAGLAEALATLMDDDIVRARMAAEAVAARDRFAITRIVQQWNEVLGIH